MTPLTSEEARAKYFGTGGLQVLTLAKDVVAEGPLRSGVDHIMWSYAGGVWSPDKHVVARRTSRLLGQHYRTGHVGHVQAFVRDNVPTITCDPVPDLINFRNGLLDWRTGELHAHDPEVASTVQLGVAHDPAAVCPEFEAFVAQVVPPDVVATVWELIGYLMYSGNPLHKAVMLTGTGRNGKGTFLRVVQRLLGVRNLTSVSLHDLVNNRFAKAGLFGKLANIAGDIDAGYLENTATFKAVTGGDLVSAEHKGRDLFDFTPWAVPVFSANKIPASADTSVGYLARWLVVPFPNDFTGREDRFLDARLAHPQELQGIAAKAVQALGALLERGDFETTVSGELAREEFIRRVDQVRTWIADCCEIAPEHPPVNRTQLYLAYKNWALRDGHKPVRASEFWDRITQAGAEFVKIRGDRLFRRIKVIDDGLQHYPGILPTAGASGLALAPVAPPSAVSAVGAASRLAVVPPPAPRVSPGQGPGAAAAGAKGAGTPHSSDLGAGHSVGDSEIAAPSAPGCPQIKGNTGTDPPLPTPLWPRPTSSPT